MSRVDAWRQTETRLIENKWGRIVLADPSPACSRAQRRNRFFARPAKGNKRPAKAEGRQP